MLFYATLYYTIYVDFPRSCIAKDQRVHFAQIFGMVDNLTNALGLGIE